MGRQRVVKIPNRPVENFTNVEVPGLSDMTSFLNSLFQLALNGQLVECNVMHAAEQSQACDRANDVIRLIGSDDFVFGTEFEQNWRWKRQPENTAAGERQCVVFRHSTPAVDEDLRRCGQ